MQNAKLRTGRPCPYRMENTAQPVGASIARPWCNAKLVRRRGGVRPPEMQNANCGQADPVPTEWKIQYNP